MRTKLTIDDFLLRQLRRKAADSGQSLKKVVNDTLRAGLARPASVPRQPYRWPSFSIGGLVPGVDLTKATALAVALEDQALIEKLRQGR